MQTEAAALRKQLEELRTQLQRNEEMVRWLNNQVSGVSADRSACSSPRHKQPHVHGIQKAAHPSLLGFGAQSALVLI
jgi:cell division septum initiation protein DivIVA